jgi:antitoxin MazE
MLKTSLTRFGNSQRIRIPKVIIEQLGLHDEVALKAEWDRLIVRPLKKVRQGWKEAARAIHEARDVHLLVHFDNPSHRWNSTAIHHK